MTSTFPGTYRAWRYTQFGDALDALSLDSGIAQKPLATATDVRVKVHYAALNPADYKIVAIGDYFFKVHPMDPPYPIGFDFAGTVVEVGADVSAFKVGDAVFGDASVDGYGTFGEYFVLDQQFVAKKPESLTFEQAAGIPLVSLTSYQALVTYGQVKQGSRVLILGGSSATGIAAVQIAKALGAHVITTTSSRNAEFVKSLGADEIVDYTTTKWVDAIDAHSLDAIYDCGMEPESWETDAQKVLKKQTGQFVTIGMTTPSESPIGATYHQFLTKPNGAELELISEFIAKKQLAAHIDSVFEFEDLLDAFRKLKTQRARGKIVLRIVKDQQ
ncbi:Reticulon-4-interacting protein 1 [Globisporangium polare]